MNFTYRFTDRCTKCEYLECNAPCREYGVKYGTRNCTAKIG